MPAGSARELPPGTWVIPLLSPYYFTIDSFIVKHNRLYHTINQDGVQVVCLSRVWGQAIVIKYFLFPFILIVNQVVGSKTTLPQWNRGPKMISNPRGIQSSPDKISLS
jgi:hypothetical protein